MSGFIYRASWPILDQDRPISALRAEAAGQIDAMAYAAGCRIAGDIRWHVVHLRLVAEAPAEPLERVEGRAARGAVASQVDHIAALAGRGMSDAEIAAVLGANRDAVRKVRQRNHIPAGAVRRALGSGTTEAA